MRVLLFSLICFASLSVSGQTFDETVNYINRILPSAIKVNGEVLEAKIECDEYGNIQYIWKYNLNFSDDTTSGTDSFSLTDEAKTIWVHEMNTGDYQLRFENRKLSTPKLTLLIDSKSSADRLTKAFNRLKSLAKADPFGN